MQTYKSFTSSQHMSADSWKKKLIGKRTSPLSSKPTGYELPVCEIDKDLTRTFPRETWFLSHKNRIRNILLWHAWTNRAISYAQPLSFIAFTLYYVFHQNDPKTSMVATYYSLHRLVSVVSPLFPTGPYDGGPVKFIKNIDCLVRINILNFDRVLNSSITPEIMNYVILNGMPTLFTNWFGLHKGVLVLDFIIDKNKEVMFSRLIKFTVAIFLTYRPLFVHLEWYDVVPLKRIFSAESIIACARNL